MNWLRIIPISIVLVSSVEADVLLMTHTDVNRQKEYWYATESQVQALNKWDPASMAPPKPLRLVLQEARRNLGKLSGERDWKLTRINFHRISSGKWSYIVSYVTGDSNAMVTATMVLLQDGTVISPVTESR